MPQSLTLVLSSRHSSRIEQFQLNTAVIAGWTGRDQAAVEKHIRELEEMGVKRPASTPIFYRVASARVTTAERIEATGEDSSGEVEFVLARIRGGLYVGVGSDHTDRVVETVGVTVSKQMCDKPIAATFWPFEEVSGHWSQLMLRSWIFEQGERRLYQEGSVTSMLDPLDLLSRWHDGKGVLSDHCLMFCGTLAAIGGIRMSPAFEFELHDPVLNRSIRHHYAIDTLPVYG
jgi:hypothetical protein